MSNCTQPIETRLPFPTLNQHPKKSDFTLHMDPPHNLSLLYIIISVENIFILNGKTGIFFISNDKND